MSVDYLLALLVLLLCGAVGTPPEGRPVDAGAMDQVAVPTGEQLSQIGWLAQAETASFRDFLGAASGAMDPCAGALGPCGIDADLVRVVQGSLERCDKLNLGAKVTDPAYRPEADGYWLVPLQGVCDRLVRATEALGAPAETDAWRAELRAIWATLPEQP